MNDKRTPLTFGEARTMVAIIAALEPEDVTDFIVITRGKCNDCDSPDAYSMITAMNLDEAQVRSMINDALQIVFGSGFIPPPFTFGILPPPE